MGPSKSSYHPDATLPDPRPTLLTLPAELRNRIYQYALVEEHPICALQTARRRFERRCYQKLCAFVRKLAKAGPTAKSDLVKITMLKQPALTRVSHQIRHECLPVFYRQNTFYVKIDIAGPGYARHLETWLSRDDQHLIWMLRLNLRFICGRYNTLVFPRPGVCSVARYVHVCRFSHPDLPRYLVYEFTPGLDHKRAVEAQIVRDARECRFTEREHPAVYEGWKMLRSELLRS